MAALVRAAYNYTETRLNLDNGYSGFTIELDVATGKRTTVDETAILDEDAFAREHLASDGSIYFRRESRYPRSFLWRLLDGRKVLELQSVDLTQDSNENLDGPLTVRLRFAYPIRPFGVAFGDPDEKDALAVFVISSAGELFTINLGRDVFAHRKSTDTLSPDWCKIFRPSAFRLKTPYRLTAVSAHDLFVSLSDGDILRLARESGEDGKRNTLASKVTL
jgi:hypothetical protein